VLDVLKHTNSPYSYRELVLMLKDVKNQSSVCREIKRLMKMEQLIRVEIEISNSRKVVLYRLNRK